jgi:Xaa-Pro aminopeptidase
MKRPFIAAAFLAGCALLGLELGAQAGRPQFSTVFPREEFAARRGRIYDAIGSSSVALLQGAPSVHSSTIFRQSNEFFYVTGVTVPQAYLLLDGASRRATLYLPKRDERRALTEGDLWTPEEASVVVAATGIEEVKPIEQLTDDLKARAAKATAIFTPFRPAEGDSESRDGATRRNNDAAADPWDGRPTRESRFVDAIKSRAPGVEVKDLSPALDVMRASKSPAEIAVIERATRIGGEAILEAMRSTEPGVMESEIDAIARFIFVRHGAQGEAYRAIVASGPTAWNAHHRAAERPLPAGELVLMDYCPDVSYYRCDVTRMWPVDGAFNPWQRELYGFYLGIYEAILASIRPNITGQTALQEAVTKMEAILAATTFSKPTYEKAARAFVDQYRRSSERQNAGLGHAVGMSTHDFGGGSGLLKPGMVFTIEPQFRVPEEQIYIRLEDMIVITETGRVIQSDWLPRDMAGVERVMKEPGLLQQYPRIDFRR